MSANYYRSVLGGWEGLDKQVKWLEERCDSKLEVLTALALLGVFESCARGNGRPGHIDVRSDHIYLMEPFSASPTWNGVSVAFLTCQFQMWDFCIHTAHNNGAEFADSKPALLIDIDGYGIHRNRRLADERKLAEAKVRAMRLPEERFTDVWQMGWCVVWSGLFGCLCFLDDPQPDCDYCNNIKWRAIFS